MKKSVLTLACLAVALIALTWGGLAVASGEGHLGHGHLGHGHFAKGHGFGGLGVNGHGGHEGCQGPCSHAHAAIVGLIHDLDLNKDQQGILGGIHNTLLGLMHDHQDMRQRHLSGILERVEDGYLDPAEARAAIDAQLATLGERLYPLSDQMADLVNSMNPEQREILEAHLQQALEARSHGADSEEAAAPTTPTSLH